MTRDDLNLDEQMLADIFEALEAAMDVSSWDCKPIGFLPCQFIQQFADVSGLDELLDDDDIEIEIIDDDLSTPVC